LELSETEKYRKFTAQQKSEIVLAWLRGPKTMSELCREHDVADGLLVKWREQFLAAGRWGSRSRANSCGDGSEDARRPFASSSRKPPCRGRRQDRWHQPPGDLAPARPSARGSLSAAERR
jgi:hypothetical protein